MKKYAFRRLLQLIPILFAITFLSYGMMRIAGSDVVTQKMENTGQIVSEDRLNAAREQLGLDKPFLTQYFVWLGKLLHGDMGNSYVSSLPVFDTFISKLPATLLLTVTSILLTIIISIPLGILSAVKQNTIMDYLIRLCSFIGNSLPNFFVSLLLMYFLAIRVRIFPVIGKDVSLKSVAMLVQKPALRLYFLPFSQRNVLSFGGFFKVRMGERSVRIREVKGSNPSRSTILCKSELNLLREALFRVCFCFRGCGSVRILFFRCIRYSLARRGCPSLMFAF